MTMEELLESLTKKTRTECEESHRQLIAAFNGMAGWYIINQQVSVQEILTFIPQLILAFSDIVGIDQHVKQNRTLLRILN